MYSAISCECLVLRTKLLNTKFGQYIILGSSGQMAESHQIAQRTPGNTSIYF